MARPFVLRPAGEADEHFLRALHASTRPDLAVLGLPAGQLEALLDLQHRARETSYRQQFPGAQDRLVVVGGTPVGRLLLAREPGRTRVVDLALLPQARGRGIGTAVLRGVLEEAQARGWPVTLHVEAGNPARALYERLGFRVVAEQPPYQEMEWRPEPHPLPEPSTQPPASSSG